MFRCVYVYFKCSDLGHCVDFRPLNVAQCVNPWWHTMFLCDDKDRCKVITVVHLRTNNHY